MILNRLLRSWPNKITSRIETGVSQSDIYDAILPVLKEFEDETLPQTGTGYG